MSKKKKIVPKVVTTHHVIKEEKREIRRTFYKVITGYRSFFVDELDELLKFLKEEEKSYSVVFVEYIGYYKGKEDVLCLHEDGKRTYVTNYGIDRIMVYDEYVSEKNSKNVWIAERKNLLEPYYQRFKDNGIILTDDVFKREKMFKETVLKLTKNF